MSGGDSSYGKTDKESRNYIATNRAQSALTC